MAGAALVHSVCATTPAETHRLARRPRTMGVPVARSAEANRGETAPVIAIVLVPLDQSLEPPSTRSVSPVIQRAASEARKAIASPMSSGWATRFRACRPSVKSRPRVGPGEARHVGLDNARRDGVDADAALTERGGEVLHQRVDGPLRRGIGDERADRGVRGERRQQHDAAAIAQDRQQLLHQEERRADVDGEQAVEVLDRGVLDRGILRDAGVGDEDVQPVADDAADLGGQLCGPSGAAMSADTASARPPAARISRSTASASAAPRP